MADKVRFVHALPNLQKNANSIHCISLVDQISVAHQAICVCHQFKQFTCF
ncbi:hypothetical protein AC26_4154 [Escherichia coli 1-176-05_S3_C2]|nr:hypothetical protein AC26_4154 [Escherichia coli 1-176-05_S3_C2]